MFRHGKVCALASLVATVMAVPVQAQETLYFGIDAHAWSLSPDRGDDWENIGIRGKLGGRVAENVAIEGHLATGGSDRANGTTLDLDYLAGVFLRGDIPLTRYTSLYGLVGFSEIEFSPGNRRSQRDSSVSFGFGGDFEVSDNTSLNIDWIRYIGETDYDYSALSLGARWRF